MQDPESWIQGLGSSIQDPGFWIQDSVFRILDALYVTKDVYVHVLYTLIDETCTCA